MTADDKQYCVLPISLSWAFPCRPSEIIVRDALPATSTGKIIKHKLAETLCAS
jgi:acyl-CoA synthetase (AMP-forming)/AMP-acid ligase II